MAASLFRHQCVKIYTRITAYRTGINSSWQGPAYTLLLPCTLEWRHNERNGVSNHRHLDCLFSLLFRRPSKKTPKPRVTGLYEGNPPVTGGFPSQRASDAENVSIWWRHHVTPYSFTWSGEPYSYIKARVPSTMSNSIQWNTLGIYSCLTIRICLHLWFILIEFW